MENLFTVSQLFAGRLFSVPDYQRGYAWEQEQCQDFIDDLDLLAPEREHFMGLLILHEKSPNGARVLDHKANAHQRYDVVDGQQRLTTLVVFLHCLEREMAEYPNLHVLAQSLKETYLGTKDMDGGPLPKLTLNSDTHAFFYGTVLNHDPGVEGPTIRSHRLLADARRAFQDYFRERRQALAEAYPDWLREQYLKVTHQMTVVVYTVTRQADAGVVFETMNNRGRGLTELEKVKNYLLYLTTKLELHTEHGLAQYINETWTHIFRRLMAADLSRVEDEDQLLRAHWLMAYDYSPASWKGSRSIQGHFSLGRYQDRHETLLQDLRAYLSSLQKATVAYCDVHHPKHPGAYGAYKADGGMRNQLRDAGGALARLGAPVAFLPLIMAVRIKAPEDANACLVMLELCERFAFRVYRWLERPAYTGQTRLFRLGNQIYQGRSLESVADELRHAILEYCPDDQFAARFERDDVDWYAWRGLKYMLYEYERHLAQEAGKAVRMPWETLTRSQDTLEHIMPQHRVRGGYWAQRFTPDQHRRWLHDIGNLTLTYDNSVLGAKTFPNKKGAAGQPKTYAGSKLFVEQAIARYDDWTLDAILARRKEIADWAIARWHVDPPEIISGADTVKLIVRVVSRAFIPRAQFIVYATLLEAGVQGVSMKVLLDRIRISGAQLAGVMGALGRRVNTTEGLGDSQPGTGLLMDWRMVDGITHYTMRPELREALEELPRLHNALTTWTLEEINEAYRERWGRRWRDQRADLDLPEWV
jgi:hypothetical protein